ncbi:hypothetical protein D3C87_362940 [compost metagenome]
MTKSKRKSSTTSYTAAEVQESGNILLDNTLEAIRKKFPDHHISKVSEEHQKDKGIDFQIEIEDKKKRETIILFKIQNKGTADNLKPLIQTTNSGMISFQETNKHIKYFRRELPLPMMFLVCDVVKRKVYWHPIQLDDELDERVEQSIVKGSDSIQLYIDPKKVLNPKTFIEFLDEVHKSKSEQFFRTKDLTLSSSADLHVDNKVSASKPVLDQIYDLVSKLYEQINYLPTSLLIKNFPFQQTKTFVPYFHSYTVYTDNEELVDLFSSIKMKDNGSIEFLDKRFIDGIKNYKKKTETVLRVLHRNHIYSLIHQRKNKEARIDFRSNKICKCAVCRYFGLDFKGSMEALDNQVCNTVEEKLKFGYLHYQFGNYLKAAHLIEKAASQAKKSRKRVYEIIARYNLKKLGRFIRNYYFDHETTSYGEKLEGINLDDIVFSARSGSYEGKILSWISQQHFFYEMVFDIHKGASGLRDEYQGHINGSNGSTQNYRELAIGYAQLNSSVNDNYLIYDRFGEYKAQTEEFIEGVFAAYAMRDAQGNMPKQLLAYHQRRLIFDGNHKNIWRYFNKYHLETINFEKHGVKRWIDNLLNNNHLIRQAYKSYSPEEGSSWRNKYPDIFCNTLCVAAITKMEDQDAEDIAIWIISCFEKADLPSPDCYGQINSFLNSKRSSFSDRLLVKMVDFFLEYGDLSSNSRIEILSGELRHRKLKITLDSNQKTRFLKKCLLEKDSRSFNQLVYMYPILEEKIQQEILKKLKLRFDKKLDSYEFYYAVIFDIFSLQSEYTEKFVAAAHNSKDQHTLRSAFYNKEDNRYPLLDMLCNLCFKNNCLPKDISNLDFSGFGEYYDWLMDISDFDYINFKLDWLLLYPTKFFFMEFRKHSVIKIQLESYLKQYKNPKFERLYVDLYVHH